MLGSEPPSIQLQESDTEPWTGLGMPKVAAYHSQPVMFHGGGLRMLTADRRAAGARPWTC